MLATSLWGTSRREPQTLMATSNSEVAVKNRASLLKTLTRFDRCSEMCLARIENDSMWTLNSGDTAEWAMTSRQIARVQLSLMKLSRELAVVSRQIRELAAGKSHCLAMPAPVNRRNYLTDCCKANQTHAGSAPRLQQLPRKTARLWCAFCKILPEYGLKASMATLRPGRRRRGLPACSIKRMALILLRHSTLW